MSSESVVSGRQDGTSHRLRGLVNLVVGAVLVVAVVFALTAGVGAIWSAVTSSSSPGASAAPAGGAPVTPAAVALKMTIDAPPVGGVKGSNGMVDEAYTPATLTMSVGTTYDVTILNYSKDGHTWTLPELNVNAVVPVGSSSSPSVTHFTVTPKKAGTYQWFCAVPCEKWSMATNGFMRGYVVVKA